MNYPSSDNPGIENPRQIILIRGVSGCGKSLFANFLQSLIPDAEAVVCTADDFFYEGGVYKFDASKLFLAHKACQQKFKKALDNSRKLVIVANTNTSPKEWKYYEEEAKKAGYRVFFVVLENRHGGNNIHGVPKAILEAQESRIKQSLKLR